MKSRHVFFGFVLVLIGFLLLMRSTGLFFFSFGDFISAAFPLLIIALGVWLILKKRQQERMSQADDHFYQQAVQSDSSTLHEPDAGMSSQQSHTNHTGVHRVSEAPDYHTHGKLKYSKLFGDMYIDCANTDLQSIEISTFVGDLEIKLHGGKLAPGLNRMILSGFVGNTRVLVPPDMAVFVQCSNFIGDIELMGRRSGGFGNNIDAQTPDYATAESKLYIASNHFIGDVKVYVV